MRTDSDMPIADEIRALDTSRVAVGSTLRLLRQRIGLTARDLAEAVGRSAAYVSKAESGGTDVTGPMLEKFATALEAPSRLLCELVPIEPPEGIHFRSQTVPQHMRHKAIAIANLAGFVLNQLSSSTSTEHNLTRTFPAYDADLMAGGAQEAAALLRHQWRLYGPIRDIADLLEQAGVFILDMPDDIIGIDAVTVRTSGPVTAVIMLNNDLPEDRKRHTLAHELAHLVLDQATFSRSMRDNEERADLFAGEFLAPYNELHGALRGITPAQLGDLEQLRSIWGVSLSSLIRRAYIHGDISESQYRYWYRVLNSRDLLRSKRSWTTPVRSRSAAEFLSGLRSSGYSATDICEITSMSLRELKSIFGDAWPFIPLPPRLKLVGSAT
ncbi:helix-turn-helix domain-containing protein [Mycobacteroides abscessus]|uniref:helix-turn-helix domain-containing protein n=1 Tax=Mycobacteroides abscessus TaxID=36809 RepID=UPI00232E0944|nr:XRE family transcriptional regulator [Mycobacteroides abscessus]MDB2197158.1 XRE family transcriptional regulator [Mycobacteroides abscessus subsp. abscessus]MDB2201982.1 XRE family transcriptional regulator [Mycobacteroides abscessus subsp. abscessus]